MKLLIKITKDVLKESMFCKNIGTSESTMVGQNCAIGKAIFNLFGNKTWVSNNNIHYYKNGVNFDYSSDYTSILPQEARDFIEAFDKLTPEGRLTLPELRFVIDVPNEVIDWIGIPQVYKVLSESKSMNLVS